MSSTRVSPRPGKFARGLYALLAVILTILTGAVAGGAHVVLAPDHLAALAPLSVEARRRAWQVGLRWGIGHAAGIALVGGAARLASHAFNVELLGELGGYAVGLTLIAIGAWGFLHVRRGAHLNPAAPSALEPHVHATAAFVVGTVHGVAGTGALLGVIPVLALPEIACAIAYLSGFAVGTVGAMTGAAALLGLAAPEGRGDARAALVYRRVFLGASGVALAVGAGWMGHALLG